MIQGFGGSGAGFRAGDHPGFRCALLCLPIMMKIAI